MNAPNDPFQLVRRGDDEEIAPFVIALPKVDFENSSGQNLLHEAIAFAKPKAARALIQRGIDLNKRDHDGATPLHFAAAYRRWDIVTELLRAGARVDVEDDHGNQPLWTALFNATGDYRSIEALLAAGADPDHRNKHGRRPRDIAAISRDPVLHKLVPIDV